MSFTSDMRKFAEKAGRGFDQVVTESLIDLTSSVIIKTPVDTGMLANNWRPSDGAPESGTLDGPDDGSQAGKVERAVAASVGGVYWLVNNLEYAEFIEFDGHSEKAEAGMLRISIENYQNHINNAINNLDN